MSGYVLFIMLCLSNNCTVAQAGVYGAESSCISNGKEAIVDSKRKPDQLQATGFYCMMRT